MQTIRSREAFYYQASRYAAFQGPELAVHFRALPLSCQSSLTVTPLIHRDHRGSHTLLQHGHPPSHSLDENRTSWVSYQEHSTIIPHGHCPTTILIYMAQSQPVSLGLLATLACHSVSQACPVEATIYGFRPDLVINTIFAFVFFTCAVAQLSLGYFSRAWTYSGFVALGCSIECVGKQGALPARSVT